MFLPGLKTGFVMLKFAQGAFAALMLIVVNGFANAQTAMIDRFVPEAALVGEARFKVLLFPVYDADEIKKDVFNELRMEELEKDKELDND